MSNTPADLAKASWTELLAIEQPITGRLLFPSTINRRRANGAIEKTPVTLRIPLEPDLRRARVMARRMAAEDGIDEQRDRELFESLETVCILADAIRNSTAPYEPLVLEARELEKNWDRQSLIAVYEQLSEIQRLADPREHEFNAEELLAVVAAIASKRSILPLHVYGSPTQASCVIAMAGMCMGLLASKSSSESSAVSTPGG